MKSFLIKLVLSVALTIPIGWTLGFFDWFWALAQSPAGHWVLAQASRPFDLVDGERADDPLVLVMLVLSFAIAVLAVWSAPIAIRAFRRARERKS
ncbi:hypothetical protein LFL96_33010 [Paraburkholderia sp. D15]|uniref:hypothetical protein n=1 Tax=Paraburkholderia sp. D15 TaxID=2880218 RepID=UPI0024795068|nr:hypothetical protein [Paraburkholderia sp. D15]WGS52992.1 hypothetical protein LFL96_33010 [Paraburkholderia sp. D15]WKF61572.1 hypothetical protein HUO10_006103 [Paraburkholderia busanensis]